MYVDSCILVKLLVPEPDSAFFDRELGGRALATSELALTEVRSALLAKERAGMLEPQDRQRAWLQFLSWIEHEEILLQPLTIAVLKKAVRLLDACHPTVPLRTLDAIHLATADLSQESPVCSTDQRVREASARLGLELFPSL